MISMLEGIEKSTTVSRRVRVALPQVKTVSDSSAASVGARTMLPSETLAQSEPLVQVRSELSTPSGTTSEMV